jgi:hypothetical protein
MRNRFQTRNWQQRAQSMMMKPQAAPGRPPAGGAPMPGGAPPQPSMQQGGINWQSKLGSRGPTTPSQGTMAPPMSQPKMGVDWSSKISAPTTPSPMEGSLPPPPMSMQPQPAASPQPPGVGPAIQPAPNMQQEPLVDAMTGQPMGGQMKSQVLPRRQSSFRGY